MNEDLFEYGTYAYYAVPGKWSKVKCRVVRCDKNIRKRRDDELTTAEIGLLLNVSSATIRKYIKTVNLLPVGAIRKGAPCEVYKLAEVRELVKRMWKNVRRNRP
jgi:hypothetical protein